MPIFQDPDRQRLYDWWSSDQHQDHYARQDSREYEQEKGSQSWETHVWDRGDGGCEAPGSGQTELDYSRLQGDRGELIQYLKRVETSRWFDCPVC